MVGALRRLRECRLHGAPWPMQGALGLSHASQVSRRPLRDFTLGHGGMCQVALQGRATQQENKAGGGHCGKKDPNQAPTLGLRRASPQTGGQDHHNRSSETDFLSTLSLCGGGTSTCSALKGRLGLRASRRLGKSKLVSFSFFGWENPVLEPPGLEAKPMIRVTIRQ